VIIYNPLNYTAQEIDGALHFMNGVRHVSFRYDLLDRSDMKIGEIDGIEGASISYGEFNTIKRSAVFQLNEYSQRSIDFMSEQIQPWFILRMPGGGAVEWPLGVFMLESPEKEIIGRHTRRNIGAYDKALILEAGRITARHFIPAGTNYAAAAAKLLSMSGINKISVAGTDSVIHSDREIPIGTKIREAVNTLLAEINYTSISVDEAGFFYSSPYAEPAQRPVTQRYIAGRGSVVMQELSETLDIAGQPNVFIRAARNLDEASELVAAVYNNNPASPSSIPNRGRQIADYAEIDNISGQQALNAYTRRIAINAMSAYSHISFNSALMPGHGGADTLYLDFPGVFDAPRLYSEISWDMELKFDGVMNHKARRAVTL
jgi:hypothetical protein